LPEILHCFIKEAMKGSIPHAKALMTIAGMDKDEPPVASTRVRRRAGGAVSGAGSARTLSELLLVELKRGSEPRGSEPAKDGK